MTVLAGKTLGSRRALCLAYGTATCLSFPQLIGGTLVDFGLWLSPLVPAFLLLLLEGLSPRKAAKWGFGASMAAHFVFFHWFFVVTVEYGHMPAPIGFFAPLLPALYVSAFTASFAAGWSALRREGLGSPFVAAMLWTAVDYFRGVFMRGFPWAQIGYAQHQNEALLGVTPYLGVHGMSFAVALWGAALALGFREWQGGKRPRAIYAVALIAVVLLHVVGLWKPTEPEGPVETLRVAALQGNVNQRHKWSPDYARSILNNYLELAERAVEQGAEIVVWPESAIPGLLEFDAPLLTTISQTVRNGGAIHLLGGTAGLLDTSGRELERIYDSVFVMDGEGVLQSRYDKSHLVPFGEFVPLRALIGRIFQALALGLGSIEVTAGPGPVALALPPPLGGPLNSSTGQVKVGLPICYELLFPDLVRRFSLDGARVLFAVTNDAWYGRTGAPYQFLAMTAVRSAENRLWMLRAANSGVSAIIDDRGRVVQESEIFVRDVVMGEVRLSSAAASPTFYAQYGDVFAWSCGVGVMVLFSISRFRGRHSSKGGGA